MRSPLFVMSLLLFAIAAIAGETYYEYDSNNRLKTVAYTNGVVARYHYDLAHNLTGIGQVADSDGDGLPDYWELKYFGDLTTSDGSGDHDGDGLSDLDEYLAATDPTDESSLFYVFNGSPDPATNVIRWASATNRTYTIEHTTNLVNSFTVLEAGIEGTPPYNEYRHVVTTRVNFYRIRLEAQAEGGAE